MSPEHYPVLWIDQTAVIMLPAEIDITNADQVREDLLSVLNQGAVLLVADLSKTTFCDSAGVSALQLLELVGTMSSGFTHWVRATRGGQVKRLWSGPSPGPTALAAAVVRGQRRNRGGADE